MKKALILAALAVVLLPSVASARHRGYDYGYRRPHSGFSFSIGFGSHRHYGWRGHGYRDYGASFGYSRAYDYGGYHRAHYHRPTYYRTRSYYRPVVERYYDDYCYTYRPAPRVYSRTHYYYDTPARHYYPRRYYRYCD